MTTLHEEQQYDVPADQIWNRIGDFYAIHTWEPAVATTERLAEPKNARRVTMQDGSALVEQLVEQSAHSQRYRMLSGPVPVRDFEGVIAVHDDAAGKGCVVTWDAHFEPLGVSGEDVAASL